MWLYEGKPIESMEDMPEGTFGFIYEVTHIPTGRKYIGKKQLMMNRTLPPLKGQKRKRKVVKEGDWKTYYGSQSEIKSLLKEGSALDFSRIILNFVPSKKLLTYYELKYLFAKGVLEPESNYLNDNISGRFFRKDFL
jgi:hypothetical protein